MFPTVFATFRILFPLFLGIPGIAGKVFADSVPERPVYITRLQELSVSEKNREFAGSPKRLLSLVAAALLCAAVSTYAQPTSTVTPGGAQSIPNYDWQFAFSDDGDMYRAYGVDNIHKKIVLCQQIGGNNPSGWGCPGVYHWTEDNRYVLRFRGSVLNYNGNTIAGNPCLKQSSSVAIYHYGMSVVLVDPDNGQYRSCHYGCKGNPPYEQDFSDFKCSEPRSFPSD
jgi:hypothetical protein